jgi:hypothetical protein
MNMNLREDTVQLGMSQLLQSVVVRGAMYDVAVSHAPRTGRHTSWYPLSRIACLRAVMVIELKSTSASPKSKLADFDSITFRMFFVYQLRTNLRLWRSLRWRAFSQLGSGCAIKCTSTYQLGRWFKQNFLQPPTPHDHEKPVVHIHGVNDSHTHLSIRALRVMTVAF